MSTPPQPAPLPPPVGAITIANRIRRLRFDHGEMTQQELARRVGVTRQTIIALEGSKYSPTLELAFRLAAAFGVPVDGDNGVFQASSAAPTAAVR